MIGIADLPYGAFELKYYYQRNMLAGKMFSVGLAIIITASIWIYTAIGDVPDPGPTGGGRGGGGVLDSIVIKWDRGITIDPTDYPRPKPGKKKPKPKTGEIVLVDDGYNNGGDTISTPGDWGDSDDFTPVKDDGMGNGLGGFDASDEPYIPPVGTFIPCEILPVLIHEEEPKYPRLALEGGFTGTVYIEAFVGTDGLVKKAVAMKCTRPGIGFEEAALKAAYNYEYKPGIQNGSPVAVWIAYRVDFVL